MEVSLALSDRHSRTRIRASMGFVCDKQCVRKDNRILVVHGQGLEDERDALTFDHSFRFGRAPEFPSECLHPVYPSGLEEADVAHIVDVSGASDKA